MKILFIGFLAFISWSAMSDYIYVCKIRGLCSETKTIQVYDINPRDIKTDDTLKLPLAKVQAVKPGNIVFYFEFDKSEFNDKSGADKYFAESTKYLDENAKAKLSITGHTDAIGSLEYNQALGYRRAQSIQKFFESKGMPADKFILESKGEQQPVDNNNTDSGRAKNRRTEITINK
jgi:OOP family OmpA-OmpF porin